MKSKDHFKLLILFKDVILFEHKLEQEGILFHVDERSIDNVHRYYLLSEDKILIDKIIMENKIIASTETIQIWDYRDDSKAYKLYCYVAIVVTILFILAVIFSCGHKAEIKEKYCGVEMSGFEVLDYKKMGDAGYDYSEADKMLLDELTSGVNALFENKQKVEIYFAMKDADKIAIYIVAPDDKAMVEKIACYILKSEFKNLPVNRNVLFYTNEHNSLVAAVKTKPAGN